MAGDQHVEQSCAQAKEAVAGEDKQGPEAEIDKEGEEDEEDMMEDNEGITEFKDLEFEEFSDQDDTHEAGRNYAQEYEDADNDEKDELQEEEEEEEQEEEEEEEEAEEEQNDEEEDKGYDDEVQKHSHDREEHDGEPEMVRSSLRDEEDAWPAPSSAKRSGSASRRWNAHAVDDHSEVLTDETARTKSSSSQPTDRKEMRRLERENKALRLEIGQERFKVQQLQKMQADANLAHKREQEARRREAVAVRELEDAKQYVSKRHSFALNEKAQLLQQIRSLEQQLQESSDRQVALRLELQDAVQSRSSTSDQQENFQKEAERWRKDACQQSAKVKEADLRLKQLEQRRLEDKAKMKALADSLKSAMDAGFTPANGVCSPKHIEARKRDLPGKDSSMTGEPSPSKRSGPLKMSGIRQETPSRSASSKTQAGSTLLCCRRQAGLKASEAQKQGSLEKKVKPGKARGGASKELEAAEASRSFRAGFSWTETNALCRQRPVSEHVR